jgi:hypothetical protein
MCLILFHDDFPKALKSWRIDESCFYRPFYNTKYIPFNEYLDRLYLFNFAWCLMTLYEPLISIFLNCYKFYSIGFIIIIIIIIIMVLGLELRVLAG